MCPRPIRSLVVATDLTPASDAVVRAGAKLAAAVGAELHLLHACESALVPVADPLYAAPCTFPEQVQGARRALKAQAERVVPPPLVPASREVIVFAVDRAICEYARGVDADLVVVGPRRRAARRLDSVFATTAERVMRATGLPCLVAHGELALPLRRVAVPVELAEPDGCAIDTALRWSRALGARAEAGGTMEVEVRVLHLFAGRDHATASQRLHTRTDAAAREGRAADRVPVYTERLRGASPADEVLRFAEAERTDLLVMASPQRSLLRRAFSDAVTGVLQRSAPCSVLLVPPGQEDEDARAAEASISRDAHEPLTAAV